MSQAVQDFIMRLREKLSDHGVDMETVDGIVEEVLAEYEREPGDIYGIGWAVLVHEGFVGVAQELRP